MVSNEGRRPEKRRSEAWPAGQKDGEDIRIARIWDNERMKAA